MVAGTWYRSILARLDDPGARPASAAGRHRYCRHRCTEVARFERFPWPRALSARAIDVIAAAQPKSIGLDVLHVDPTSAADDDALARSIEQAGNVVVAAQLVSSPAAGGPASWLLPLPAIERAGAAAGHVNVSTEADGIAR